QLAVIRPAPPFVSVFRAVTDHQEQVRILRAHDQFVQQTESKGIVPVQVFEYRDDRLHAALAQQQAGGSLIWVRQRLERLERPERRTLIRAVEEIQHGGNRVLQ